MFHTSSVTSCCIFKSVLFLFCLPDSTNSSENIYTMMNPIGPGGNRPNVSGAFCPICFPKSFPKSADHHFSSHHGIICYLYATYGCCCPIAPKSEPQIRPKATSSALIPSLVHDCLIIFLLACNQEGQKCQHCHSPLHSVTVTWVLPASCEVC